MHLSNQTEGNKKMSLKKKAVVSAASTALDLIFKYIDKDPEANLVKIVDGAEKIIGDSIFPKENFAKLKAGAADPDKFLANAPHSGDCDHVELSYARFDGVADLLYDGVAPEELESRLRGLPDPKLKSAPISDESSEE